MANNNDFPTMKVRVWRVTVEVTTEVSNLTPPKDWDWKTLLDDPEASFISQELVEDEREVPEV